MTDTATSRPIALSWSSGKDAAWALHALRIDSHNDVRVLLTTFNERFDRAAMHGVRRELVRAQARAVGLPLVEVGLPWPCPNDVYEARMAAALDTLHDDHGITRIAFGDLFLEDVRDYRHRMLAGTGIDPMFPIWGSPTRELAISMIEAGVRAWLSCVDTRILPADFAGRAFDQALLDALPANVDPCGENGEFHTLAVDGPAFAHSIATRPGERVQRDGFAYADFLPAGTKAATATCVS